jgi:hypothetical protein
MSLGREINLVDHNIINITSPSLYENIPPINNVIYKSEKQDHKWIEESTLEIAEWRSKFRSTYIRWSLTINGLHKAAERYSEFDSKNKSGFFTVSSIRTNFGESDFTNIAQWDWMYAAEAHIKTIGMIAAWGMIDIYGCLESFIFRLFNLFLNYYPETLLEGKEYKYLRNLYRNRDESPENQQKWLEAWNERLMNWQRKKIYSGLDKVFLDYCSKAKLKEPSYCKNTTIETWAENIKAISLLRNCLVHGAEVIPKELEDLCSKPHMMGWNFKNNQSLEVNLYHLQTVDCFIDQLLSALNFSLIELTLGKGFEDIK